MKRHRIHPVSKLRKKPFGEKELFTMADFSINYRLFIDPLGNEHGERKKIDGFLDLLSASGVAGVLSPRDGKAGRPGHPECNPCRMFAAVLLAFAIDGGRLRDIESRCRFDMRFAYFMPRDTPSHATFCRFLNRCVLPNAERIFSLVTSEICRKMGIDPCSEVFVDGTKLEANANKYKFVWKPEAKMRKLLRKAEETCARFGVHPGKTHSGYVGERSELSSLMERRLEESGTAPSTLRRGRGIRNTKLASAYMDCLAWLEKMACYQEQCNICGTGRRSYYKTDHDATAMCLKEDYYSGLGSSMHAGYNIQAAVSKGIVLSYYVSQERTDYKTLPTLLEVHKSRYGSYPSAVCADAGYGGTANYAFLEENGIRSFVKANTWEGEISGKRPPLLVLGSDGERKCLSGKKAEEIVPPRHPRTPERRFFRVKSCSGCMYEEYCRKPLKEKHGGRLFEADPEYLRRKQKSYANLLSAKGIERRVNRSIQVEGTFGILKQDRRYDRFRRRGLGKVSMEAMLNFLGLNIRKYLRFVETGKNPDFWKAPEGLEPERPRRISRTVKNGGAKKKKLQPNEAARKSYRRKERH